MSKQAGFFVDRYRSVDLLHSVIFRRSIGLRHGLVDLTSYLPGGDRQKLGWSRSVLPEALATDYIEVPTEYCGGWYEHPQCGNLVMFVYPGWVNGPSDRCWVAEAFEKNKERKFVNGWKQSVGSFGGKINLTKI